MLQLNDQEIVTRTSLLGIKAAQEAYNFAQMDNCKKLGLRIGFINGTTVGGMEKSEQFYNDFINPDSNEYTPYIAAHDCGACTEKSQTILMISILFLPLLPLVPQPLIRYSGRT